MCQHFIWEKHFYVPKTYSKLKRILKIKVNTIKKQNVNKYQAIICLLRKFQNGYYLWWLIVSVITAELLRSEVQEQLLRMARKGNHKRVMIHVIRSLSLSFQLLTSRVGNFMHCVILDMLSIWSYILNGNLVQWFFFWIITTFS